MVKISAVINTRNEGSLLEDCLKSLKFCDEIVVVDMESDDNSREIAYKHTHNVFIHKPLDWVEPARNFGISKATGDWILIIDPDETVPHSLCAKLIEIADEGKFDFVRIPRKNTIFGEWMKYSRWWPDYNVRFFKKGKVEWQDIIHSIPVTFGEGLTLDAKEDLSIGHLRYTTIDQYLNHMLRYTKIQAEELIKDGYQFSFADILSRPIGEFLSRFFAGEGYKDGFHGLVLSLLQGFSFVIVYLRVWQEQGFKTQKGNSFYQTFLSTTGSKAREFTYWQFTMLMHLTDSKLKRLYFKIKRKLGHISR